MTRLLSLGIVLSFLAVGPLAAQEDGRTHTDVFLLTDGTVLRGRILSESEGEIEIEEAGSGRRVVLARAALARHKPAGEVVLDAARSALARGRLEEALGIFEALGRESTLGSHWSAAAERGVEAVYLAHAERGRSIVFLESGARWVGTVRRSGDSVFVRADGMEVGFLAADVVRILELDDLLLARGDRLLVAGKLDLAAEDFRRILERNARASAR